VERLQGSRPTRGEGEVTTLPSGDKLSAARPTNTTHFARSQNRSPGARGSSLDRPAWRAEGNGCNPVEICPVQQA